MYLTMESANGFVNNELKYISSLNYFNFQGCWITFFDKPRRFNYRKTSKSRCETFVNLNWCKTVSIN